MSRNVPRTLTLLAWDIVHPGRLRLEMARRGWPAMDLARESGVSRPTISAALAGRAIAPRSVVSIAKALERVPPMRAIDELVFGSGTDLGISLGAGLLGTVNRIVPPGPEHWR